MKADYATIGAGFKEALPERQAKNIDAAVKKP